MFRKTTLVPLIALMTLGACNTFAGMGQDMQNVGWALRTEAQRAGSPNGAQPVNPVPTQQGQ